MARVIKPKQTKDKERLFDGNARNKDADGDQGAARDWISKLSLLRFFYFQPKTIYEKFNVKIIVLIIFSVFRRSAENTLRQQELNTWVSSVGKRLHDVEWIRDFFKHQAVLID